MQWPLSYCIEMFHSTAKKGFLKKHGWKACVKRALHLYTAGAQYDTLAFCEILKDMFGTTLMRNTITDNKQDLVRVAIPSTTFDSKLCLFRSYGDVLREGEHGDYISQSFHNLRLWQAYVSPSSPSCTCFCRENSCANPPHLCLV